MGCTCSWSTASIPGMYCVCLRDGKCGFHLFLMGHLSFLARTVKIGQCSPAGPTLPWRSRSVQLNVPVHQQTRRHIASHPFDPTNQVISYRLKQTYKVRGSKSEPWVQTAQTEAMSCTRLAELWRLVKRVTAGPAHTLHQHHHHE
jgi:hypothetical protein